MGFGRSMARPVRLAPVRSKYHATVTTVDGLTFASKREAVRYSELKLLEKAGEIWKLERQVPYPLDVHTKTIGQYVADFVYYRCDGILVVEDCKGVRTPLYRWKRKHVEAQYGIRILET
jgi:Protein of unknown function (DUF1064)